MKATLRILIFFIILGLVLKFVFFMPPGQKTCQKLDLIKSEITKNGYHNRWIFISGLRYKWYNDMLPGAAADSYHLRSKAVDILVLDIDGDWKFTRKDIQILQNINAGVEAVHPELAGAFGTYTHQPGYSRFMIHLDTRGYSVKYDY